MPLIVATPDVTGVTLPSESTNPSSSPTLCPPPSGFLKTKSKISLAFSPVDGRVASGSTALINAGIEI